MNTAAAAAGAVRARGNTTAQRPVPGIAHYIWFGQSEWQGWQSAPALTLTPALDCLMLGQAPRPRATAGNAAGVGRFDPVGDAAFHPLVAVNQHINTGAVIAAGRGGLAGVRGAAADADSPATIRFTAATGTQIRPAGAGLTATQVGGTDHPAWDLTLVFTPGMTIVFTGLTDAWGPPGRGQYVVKAVAADALTISAGLPPGAPATGPDGFAIHIINSSEHVLGEESGVGALNHMRKLQLEHLGRTAEQDGRQPLLTNACIGGIAIRSFLKDHSSRLYHRVPDATARVHAAAAALGRTSVVPAVVFAQGGTDCAQRTTHADYTACTKTLVADLRADIMAATGQDRPPLFLTFQVSGPNLSGNNSHAVPMAQLDLALNPPCPDWAMIGPFYFVPDQPVPYGGVHWTGNGERWAGQMTGKVLHKILDLNQGWLPLHPTAITRRGRIILIAFHVPEPPLQFQPAYFGTMPKLFADRGFVVRDAHGGVDIMAVEIAASHVLRIRCARAFAGDVTVQYGGINQRGAGNLCDSDPAIASETYLYTAFNGQLPQENIPALVGKPYPLWNWCVLFKMPVPAD